jgi:hypothetical protein
MISRVEPEDMLLGKPVSTLGSKPEGMLFQIKL